MAAYRERSNASANEATGPPGAGHIQHHVRPTGNLHRTLNSNSTARGTYTSGRRDIDAVSSIQGPETPGAERLGWIDEEYFENNPWYDQVKRKPVFSLGGPLPRLARGPRRPKHPRRHAHEDLAERGEAPIEEDEELAAARRSPTNDTQDNSQDRPATHTASGTGHGGGQNAAGQDVFNYTPGQTDSHQADAHAPAAEDDSPEYKIDGEPLGKREAYDGEEDGEDHDPNEYRNWWARVRAKHPEPLAEFLAVCPNPQL